MRDEGAVPATIALLDGVVRIGLDDAALEAIATRDDVAKCSARDLPIAVARGATGATTVAATAHLAAPGRDRRCSRPAASAACTARRARPGTSPPTSSRSRAPASASSARA